MGINSLGTRKVMVDVDFEALVDEEGVDSVFDYLFDEHKAALAIKVAECFAKEDIPW